jgi:hypothetical protein
MFLFGLSKSSVQKNPKSKHKSNPSPGAGDADGRYHVGMFGTVVPLFL